MDLMELRKTPHLSASSVSDYMTCGLMYKLGKIDRQKPDFKPDALLFGTAIHIVLAEFYEGLSQEGYQMTAIELQQSFHTHWEALTRDRDDIQYKKGKDWDGLLLEGKELLGAFHVQFIPDEAKIIGIEEAFTFNITGLEIPVIGAYDLVLEDPSGVITIVDHKTTARAYANADVDKNLQMTIYQMAARANGFANREILLRFDCLIKTKKPKFEQYYTTRTEQDEMKTRRKIHAVYEGIQKEVFIPNEESWKCNGCMFKSACKKWFEGRKL